MHPGFVRLKLSMPPLLRRAMPVEFAADIIVRGISRRARRIWVPGWVRFFHWLRAAVHTPRAERPLLLAAPKIEKLFMQTIASSGAKAAPLAPRELARDIAHCSIDLRR